MKRIEADNQDIIEQVGYDFGLKRRSFVQLLGAGLVFAASVSTLAQQRGGRRGFGGGGAKNIAARIHFGADGRITVLTGKVEGGQGARAELTEAAAEELRVKPELIDLIMADTSQVPDDGITAGSGSTPRTVPSVRQGAAAARQALIELAAKRWSVEPGTCKARDGRVEDSTDRSISYAELAADASLAAALQQAVPADASLTSVKEWKVLGQPLLRPKGREIVTGAHQFPSDIRRPGMLYGKVLRPPSIGARLAAVELEPGKKAPEVVVVRDGDFVGVAAPTTSLAEEALEAISHTAKWEAVDSVASRDLYDHLSKHAQVPSNPFTDELAGAKQVVRQSYNVAYAQHAPLEPRAAVAEWADGKLTVWTGSQNPFGCRSELVRAFHLGEGDVRVIVPDFGAGFGGKHSGEAGVEAARLAKAAGKPVSLRWTREEEFTWAYFRPAGVIQAEASLDASGAIATWHFVNINSGGAGVEAPYRIPKQKSQTVNSAPPLRQGSYDPWLRRRIILPAKASWTNWRSRRSRTRSNSGSRTWKTRACAPSSRPPPAALAGRTR
jgi:isoquinoline 1-oxidoreductase